MQKITTLLSVSVFLITFGCETSPAAAPAAQKTPVATASSAPAASAPASSAPASASDVLVSGTIHLPEGQAVKGKAVFVSIRSLGGGPPLAAKRMAVGDFPASFALDASNVVAMGGTARPMPAEFNVKVTLDQDGDPMNKSPDDLSFVQKVKRGDKDVKMLLKKN